MTRIITDEEFVAAFDAAVEERGRDFVYPDEWKIPMLEGDTSPRNMTCLYNLDDGAPACVWGLAFHKLGLAPATGVITDIKDMTSDTHMSDYMGDGWLSLPGEEEAVSWRERADVEFRLSRQTREAAGVAQTCQDTGKTWGEASDAFHSRLDGEAPGAD